MEKMPDEIYAYELGQGAFSHRAWETKDETVGNARYIRADLTPPPDAKRAEALAWYDRLLSSPHLGEIGFMFLSGVAAKHHETIRAALRTGNTGVEVYDVYAKFSKRNAGEIIAYLNGVLESEYQMPSYYVRQSLASDHKPSRANGLPDPHPLYGDCDALGPNGSCAHCLEIYAADHTELLREAREDLTKAAKIFRQYQNMHNDKGPIGAEKAKRNADYAEQFEAKAAKINAELGD